MAKLRVLLAFLLLLWGALALAQPDYDEPGDAAPGNGADAQQDQGAAGGGAAQDDGAAGAAGQDDAAGDDAAGDAVGDDAAAGDASEDDAAGDAQEDADAEDDAAAEDDGAAGDVAGGGAAGEQPWTFAAFDANGDGSLSEEEFVSSFYSFVAGTAEAEGLQTENYLLVVQTFGLNMAQFALVNVDADGDRMVNSDELGRLASTVFDRWDIDADVMLSDQEFAGGMFTAFDTNQDEVVTAEELEDYADWFAGTSEEFEQIAGGGAPGGFGEGFFLTGDMTPVTPQPEEEAAAEEDDAMQGDDADPADDAAEEGAPGGDAPGPDVGDEEMDEEDEIPGDVGPEGAPGDAEDE